MSDGLVLDTSFTILKREPGKLDFANSLSLFLGIVSSFVGRGDISDVISGVASSRCASIRPRGDAIAGRLRFFFHTAVVLGSSTASEVAIAVDLSFLLDLRCRRRLFETMIANRHLLLPSHQVAGSTGLTTFAQTRSRRYRRVAEGQRSGDLAQRRHYIDLL